MGIAALWNSRVAVTRCNSFPVVLTLFIHSYFHYSTLHVSCRISSVAAAYKLVTRRHEMEASLNADLVAIEELGGFNMVKFNSSKTQFTSFLLKHPNLLLIYNLIISI